MKASDKAGRKVIFVGGISFSGSTLLDMMLSNDPEGFLLRRGVRFVPAVSAPSH